jgi:metal-responsive CopG/Arc/MetJ family transcriptional regulator
MTKTKKKLFTVSLDENINTIARDRGYMNLSGLINKLLREFLHLPSEE